VAYTIHQAIKERGDYKICQGRELFYLPSKIGEFWPSKELLYFAFTPETQSQPSV